MIISGISVSVRIMHAGQLVLMILCIKQGDLCHLFQVVDTGSGSSAFSGIVQRRKQHPCKDRNDRNHDQQLDQCKFAFSDIHLVQSFSLIFRLSTGFFMF